jgi:hypothetical protein
MSSPLNPIKRGDDMCDLKRGQRTAIDLESFV